MESTCKVSILYTVLMVAGGGHWTPYSRRLTPTHDNAQFIAIHPDNTLPTCLEGVKQFPGGDRSHRPATFTNPGSLSLFLKIYKLHIYIVHHLISDDGRPTVCAGGPRIDSCIKYNPDINEWEEVGIALTKG